ncbi:MAG: phenylalanine--tRNA ligase subunit alpha [Actinomycetota bacterium]
MSGPNTNYDPVEVAVLRPAAIEDAVARALSAIVDAQSLDALKQARLAHAGDDAPLSLANREIGALPPAAKADAGKRVGQARATVKQALEQREAALLEARDAALLIEQAVDVTVPVRRRPLGSRHPMSLLMQHIEDVFLAMGWRIAEGPEIEHQWFNFDALNLPQNHPARSMQDTLFAAPADSGVLLRTHTSPIQIREMLKGDLPLYIACPGRVFRADELDATHVPFFHQVEGLAVDKGLTMAHLKGALDHFAAAMFGEGVVTRLRPSFFPFTEPSAEVDLQCFVCRGASVDNPEISCRTCKSEGWIEWGGAGMVHPNVLKACGIDASEYSGFAFGMGVERTLMFRHEVSDLRDVVEGDIRFNEAVSGGAR